MKKYIDAVNYNIKYIFFYQFVFKLISLIIGIPIIKYLFNTINKLNNYEYVSLYSLRELFKNTPFVIFFSLFMLFIFLYFIFDISSIIYMIKEGLDKRSVTIKDTIKFSFNRVINIFRLRNILNLIYPLIYILFIYLGLFIISFYYIDSINIMFNILLYNIFEVLMILIIFIVLVCLFIKGFYTLFDYIINDDSFLDSYNSQILKNNLKVLGVLFLKKIIPFIIVNISIVLLSKLFFYIKYLSLSIILISILEGLILSLIIFILYYYFIKSFINDTLLLSAYYYKYTKERVSIIKDINELPIIYNVIKVLLIILFNIIIIITLYNINIGNLDFKYVTDANVEITAHRGASRVAPENSMAAFKEADKMGVNYVELDVHISKDGYIYVMHDDNLKRMLGLNNRSDEVKFKDIKDLPLSSTFSDYLDEHVPLLEDVLKWYKNKNFILNIELKPINNQYEELDKKVLDLIKKYNIQDKCVVASFNINAINYMHELDNTLNYVYLGYQYNNINYINIYSINYAGITRELVNDLHKNNKTIYAWTVDNKDIIESMISMGVDNIITNDPLYTRSVIDYYKNKDKTHIIFDLILFIL